MVSNEFQAACAVEAFMLTSVLQAGDLIQVLMSRARASRTRRSSRRLGSYQKPAGPCKPDTQPEGDIVFQIKILSALSVGDIRQYDLLPLAFSKSLSEKLYLNQEAIYENTEQWQV